MVQKILILLNMLVALGAAGVVFYSHTMLKPPPTDQVLENNLLIENAKKVNQITPVTIKKFAVNLYSQGTRLRFLDLELNILPFKEEQKDILKNSEYLFKDVVIEIASHLSPEDVNTMTGKILFQNKIKKKINEVLGKGAIVKQIYFSHFVVQ